MTDPITPPPELVQQWWQAALPNASGPCIKTQLCTQAAQWGADQELEACCSEMDGWGDIHYSAGWKFSKNLRTARRPKPPNLKEQALHILDTHGDLTHAEADTIRRALEATNDQPLPRHVR